MHPARLIQAAILNLTCQCVRSARPCRGACHARLSDKTGRPAAKPDSRGRRSRRYLLCRWTTIDEGRQPPQVDPKAIYKLFGENYGRQEDWRQNPERSEGIARRKRRAQSESEGEERGDGSPRADSEKAKKIARQPRNAPRLSSSGGGARLIQRSRKNDGAKVLHEFRMTLNKEFLDLRPRQKALQKPRRDDQDEHVIAI
jgi:hypothetical protein